MHPMKYAAIMKGIENNASELMTNVFPGTVGASGKQFPIPSTSFENNPTYILLGGGRHTNYGYRINTAKQFSSYQKNMMKTLFDQGNQLSKSKNDAWDSMWKEDKLQGANCR